MEGNHIKVEKAVKEIKSRGLDGLIVYSRGTCDILGPKPMMYFAEYRPLGPNNALLLSKEGNSVLLVEPAWDAPRAGSRTWVQDVRGTPDFTGELVLLMDQLGFKGKVGLVGSAEMNERVYSRIERLCTLVPVDDVITDMAEEKTEREVEIARKVGAITDKGFNALYDRVRVGMREYELLAELELAMRSAGADDTFNFISTDKHNYAMHNPTDKRLTPGDIIIAEITAACEGQFVQLCRTVVLGDPGPVLREKYDMLGRALASSLAQVRAGVKASQISIAMNGVIGEAGYGKYCYPPYMRARGHGIGVGSIAPGAVIDDETEGILQKNQVIVVHPNQYLPETGYLACGETVLVTDSGLERLSETETKLYIKEV